MNYTNKPYVIKTNFNALVKDAHPLSLAETLEEKIKINTRNSKSSLIFFIIQSKTFTE